MSIEEDIEKFYDWATALGCPRKCLPSIEALKPILKSRSRELIINLMDRVQPIDKASDIKYNFMVNKMLSFKNQIIPRTGRSLLPKQIQCYLNMKDLTHQKQLLECQYNEAKNEFDTLLKNFYSKNIKSVQLVKERSSLRSKVMLLRLKLNSLKNEIEKEKESKTKILGIIPFEITAKNIKEQKTIEAVQKSFSELEEFYKVCSNDFSPMYLRKYRDDLWENMRKIFHNIPNYLIYNEISRLKEEQLQNIKDLKKANNQHNSTIATSSSSALSKDFLSLFEEKLIETKVEVISMAGQFLKARSDHLNIDKKFSNDYHPFIESLRNQIVHFNPDKHDPDEIDEVINDYIVQYHINNFYTVQNEFLELQIELYKTQLDKNIEHLHSHERLLSSINDIYMKINDSVNRIQYEALQLAQIRDKILYCKNLMQQKISNFQRQNIKKWKKNDLSSMSFLNLDGFEPANESLFSSTKLDFEGTIATANNLTFHNRSYGSVADLTVLPSSANNKAVSPNNNNNNLLPPIIIEISTFLNTALHKLQFLPNEWVFHLSPTPLVFEASEHTNAHSRSAMGSLLTALGALREAKNNIKWIELIEKLPKEFKTDQEIVSVNVEGFEETIRKQNDKITELLKKTDESCSTTSLLIEKLKKYYEFTIDNPLRRYIPPTKLFCNQSYDKYEAEFLLYYRIVNGGS